MVKNGLVPGPDERNGKLILWQQCQTPRTRLLMQRANVLDPVKRLVAYRNKTLDRICARRRTRKQAGTEGWHARPNIGIKILERR